MPYIAPEQYEATAAFDLLEAAVEGFIGFDQRLIHALVDHPEKTIPGIVRYVNTHKVDPEFLPDFAVIFRALNTPEAIPFYIAAIRSSLGDVSDDLTEAVVALGRPVLDPLLGLYHDIEDEEQNGDIAFMLAGLEIRDQRILDILLDRLEYDTGDGALLLALYGDPAAIPHLRRMLEQIPADDKHLRRELEDSISQIEPAKPVERDLHGAFDIFSLYPDEAGPSFDILSAEDRLNLLASGPTELRAEAAASFRNDDYTDSIRDRLFDAARQDAEPYVRGRAWEALASRANEKEIHASMLDAARNAPIEERTGALVGLASAGEVDPAAIPLIEALYGETGGRTKAVEAMWKSLDTRFRKYMPAHLEDDDPVLRHHAIYGIGYLGMGSEAPRLTPLFQDEDFRHDALLAYTLAVPAEIARSRVKPLFRRIETLAGGLTEMEAALVEQALDQRLMLRGMKPVFEIDEDEEEQEAPIATTKAGRNDPCPCGSGKKYKKCCGQ